MEVNNEPTLESDGAFEDRMSALARELGARGRAEALVVVVSKVVVVLVLDR